MAKRLNVSLGFTADTAAAKAALQDLQKSLTSLSNSAMLNTKKLGLTQELNEAANAASQLKIKLQEATTPTGSLDLGKFNQSLKASGQDLKYYAAQLKMLGPEGQQAFSQLAQSITLAEVPLRRSSKLLSEFATTMKNTVRWQLSSSMLHGFMGAIQSATGYAKDLNKSLNNIRIVTGQNADQMADFATKANEAAKALSTTTTEYTNAALIYYQQGLSDEDVQKRTDLTIKMANVSGQSAEVVSDQLTAIWNNFAEGSDNLEHYADVLAKLGAETASSSDEIAQGMEKFAAIGEMIGLSYDNAAAALATVTAETRQSADVVGTAFKTIFARIQGLSLGETLDDGTNLNKYSEALNKVGISIFEQNGELKDMDNILAEMGAKWELLSKDQQVALAQTVAGVRQYNQLVALMDNYDIYQENIERAQNSEGTLQEQADIYAESWEGASKNVTAALQKIYQTLLDDDVFIEILHIVEDLVSGVGGFIDAIGGLKGVLPIVATLLMKAFGPDMAASIDRIGYNITLRTKKGMEEILQMRKDAIAANRDMYDDGSVSGSAMVDVGKKQADLQEKLLEKTLELERANKELTAEEEKRAQSLLDQNKLLVEQYATTTRNVEASEELTEDLLKRLNAQVQNKDISVDVSVSETGKAPVVETKSFKEAIQYAGDLQKTYKQSQQVIKSYGKAINNLSKTTDKSSTDFKNLQSRVKEMTKAAIDSGAVVDKKLAEALKSLGDAANSGDIDKMQSIIYQIGVISEDAGVNAYNAFESIRQSAQNAGVDLDRFNPVLDKLQAQFEQTGALTAEQIQLLTNLGVQFDNAGKIIGGFQGKVATVGDAVSTSVTAAVSLGTALTQVQNAIKNLYTNEDASGLEKFVSILMLATTATQAFQSVQKAGKTIDEAIAGVKARKAAASAAAAAAQNVETVATNANTGAVNANKLAWLTHPILGIIAVALMAVVGVVTAVNEKIKKNSEALQASADEAREAAEEARELEKVNRDNLQTMNELLSVYEKTGEGKEDLDKIARTLADAYGIEGAALASLTGEYADYKKVSDAAYEAHKAELEEQLKLEEKALTTQGDALKDTAIYTKLDGGGNSVYEDLQGKSRSLLTFDGYGNENEIVDALVGMGLGFSRVDRNDVTFGYSLEDPESIVAAYDKVLKAKEQLREVEGISEAELKDSGVYEDMDAWLDAMKDDVEEYRVLLEQVNKVKDELGQFGATEEVKESNAALVDELQNVSSLEEYQAWITKITQAFKNAGIQGTELEKRLKTLTDNSFNPLIKTFKTQDDALTELTSKVGKGKQQLSEFFNSLDEDDQAYFWQINLRADEETWQQQIEILKYKAEQEKIQVQIEAVTSAQSSLKENMSKEDYEKIRESGIDWGNAEEGIIEFSEFVKMSYEEQVNFLNSLSGKYRDNSLQNIAVTKQEMEERKAIVEKELDETLEYIKNQDLPEPKRVKYEADAEALSKELEQLEKDLDNISADVEIDLIIDQQEDIKELQTTFDRIKNSITPLTNIFDSIASGIKQTMDDSGNAVWGFSKEAVQAVESIYPGFMQNLTLLKDGTFAVSNEMYQAIFDAENGALLANTEATAGKLQNLATEAYAKADYYEQAAQAAYELAKGEVDANGVVKEDKQKTLLEAVQNTQEADNDIVTMTEETLGQQLDADNQYRNALQGTAEYQSTSTEEAAKNMAYNTASGAAAAMTNLGRVRDAAYAAAKQVAQIGSDAPQFETFDEALQWDATGRVDIKAADTSDINSLVKTIGSQLDLNIGDGENDEAEKSAAYQALGDSLAQTAAQWREAGNTAMATLSELLGSVSDASDAVDEIDKNASKALEDLAERYHEITREIQAQEHALNKLEKAKNRAFGGDKLGIIEKEIQAYKDLQTEQNKIYTLQLGALVSDQQALQAQFNNEVQFDKDTHEITNFTDLYNSGNEEQRKALEQYEQTLDALRDQEMTLEDIFDKLQELHYEKLTYKLELELEINDEALKEVEYKLKQMENDFFKMAEMATLTYGNRTLIEDSYSDLTTFESALKADYDAGKISQAQYIEGLQTIRDNVYGLVDSLMELDDTMTHYYGDTLTAGAEQLALYTAEMDQLVSVLDHYMNLADILGKSKDYEMMGNFLQGKADIIADELAIATKDYDYLAAQKAEIQNIFFNMKPDDENYDYWEEQWRAISEATNEAQETLLSKTEEWAESMKAVIENNLAAAADNLENLLTGDTSFNEMMTELERLNERQEEFLTKTNQVYETNKMIRTAQGAIDKTDNLAAKTKLNNFVKETQALQEKNQLSSYELELQQSKYDLLLAEIALAEAQNAKSTVRLSRDDEGNFGYVYTADQDAIDQAEQEVEDAENALYNKSLEGVNEYTEKYAQAKRDMYDELTELQNQYLNGEIASEEEYNRLREQILEHYLGPNGILTQYQDLYRIAVSANSAAAEEAWNDDYIDMTEDVEDLRDAVDEYLQDVDEDFATWQTVSTTANTTVKGALEDSKTATDNLTSASELLRAKVENDLLPALQTEYDLVWDEVEAYAAKRTEVKGLITDYLNYISTLNQVIAAEARKEQKEEVQQEPTTEKPSAEPEEETPTATLSVGSSVTVKSSATHFSRNGGNGTKMKSYVPGNNFIVKKVSGEEVLIGDPHGPNYSASGVTGWVKKSDLVGFLSGGYTGAWGPEGKLAMLHEKELVLNSQDTENMLGVIMAVREIMKSIDQQATWASSGLGMLTAAGYNSMSQNLEQTVTIHAEFPNATNHNEIEEAFNTLINRASQYANRK